jgi:hypothetical protein
LEAVEELASVVEDVPLLDSPHALMTSTTIAALMARRVFDGMASTIGVDPGRLSILRDALSSVDLPDI